MAVTEKGIFLADHARQKWFAMETSIATSAPGAKVETLPAAWPFRIGPDGSVESFGIQLEPLADPPSRGVPERAQRALAGISRAAPGDTQ